MRPNEEYQKALEKALSELERRVQERDLVNAHIAGLKQTVRVLAARVPLPPAGEHRVARVLAAIDCATPSLTNAVRGVLTRAHPKDLTAIEIHHAVRESGFDFDEFSNSLSACHAALKRLLIDQAVTPGGMRNGKPTYRAVIVLVPTTSVLLVGRRRYVLPSRPATRLNVRKKK